MKNKKGEKLRFIKCDLCNSNKFKDYIFLNEYKYVKCQDCGLIYQNPQPIFKHLKNRYSKKYFYYELRNQHNFFELMRKTLIDIKFLEKITPEFKTPRKFLDIGCATGLLLNYIRQFGWDVTGIELDKYSAEYARKNFKLNIINKSLEETKLPGNSFDVIHWSHVIEHLPSPSMGLKKIYKLLKPNGYMLLTTPRFDSFQRKLFKKHWRSFHRDHLTLFTKKTLFKIIKKENFKILKSFSWGGIEKGKAPKFIKTIVDKLAKTFNFGDVIFVLAKKI